MNPTPQQFYDGSAIAEPEPITLRAGALRLEFDAGSLRAISYGETPVLQQVYAAVRDHNWGTVAGEIRDLHIETRDRSFDIRFDMIHRAGAIDFVWHGSIIGAEDSAITFTFDGKAKSSFLRNRIGFCVLHSMHLAGQPCVVEHVDGTTTSGHFPRLVSPHQPFFNMRAISHQVAPGVRARVLMEGDVFEMEDQRNWTDASYKTYCTPLGLPYPQPVAAGNTVSQSITITLAGAIALTAAEVADETIITPSDARAPLCQLGLALPTPGSAPSDAEARRLQRLKLSHLRGEVRLYEADAEAQLRYALECAALLGLPLELVTFVSDAAATECIRLARWLHGSGPDLARLVVFHKDEKSTGLPWTQAARQHLSAFGRPIGAGADYFFTELNREPPADDALDFVVYSINPQVHAFDNRSLVETLAGHVPTIESAQRLALGKPVVISPITLKTRRNPDAAGAAMPAARGELPPDVDPRQMSLFGAGWTLGSVKYCAENGVEAATYFETTGWRGVMETQAGSRMPSRFASIPGAVFPMYHIFAALGDYAGGEVVVARSSAPLNVEILWLHKTGMSRIMLANLTRKPQRVSLPKLAVDTNVRLLDETTVGSAVRAPEAFWETAAKLDAATLSLSPYGIAFIDFRDSADRIAE